MCKTFHHFRKLAVAKDTTTFAWNLSVFFLVETVALLLPVQLQVVLRTLGLLAVFPLLLTLTFSITGSSWSSSPLMLVVVLLMLVWVLGLTLKVTKVSFKVEQQLVRSVTYCMFPYLYIFYLLKKEYKSLEDILDYSIKLTHFCDTSYLVGNCARSCAVHSKPTWGTYCTTYTSNQVHSSSYTLKLCCEWFNCNKVIPRNWFGPIASLQVLY